MAVLGNRGTGLLDMAIEAFKDQSIPNQQLAPTVPGQNTVLRAPQTVRLNPRPVATIQTNPELNRAPSMPLGQGVRATPQMMAQMAAISAATPAQSTQTATTGVPRMSPEQYAAAMPRNPALGADMVKMAEDADKVVREIQRNPQLEQDPSFMDQVKGYFGNRENMVKLALAFNSMRLTPDQGLAAALSAEQKDLRAQRTTTANATRTAQVLKAKHPQLAALLEQGVIDAKTAIQLTYKNPTELTQMMELFKENPEMFKQLAASGAFGGDVDFGQGKMYDEMAKQNIKTRDILVQGGTNARLLMNDLMRFQMQAEGLETGPLQERLQSLREFGASIGIPVDDVRLSQGQSLNAAAFELVAKQLRQNKGPQTDFDAEFTSRFVPSLGNTSAANQEITNYLQSANRLMTIFGSQAGDMPIGVEDADKFLMGIQRTQQNTPAVTKFGGQWITFEEYYQEAKRLSRDSGQPLTDMQIVEQWTKDHREKGQL